MFLSAENGRRSGKRGNACLIYIKYALPCRVPEKNLRGAEARRTTERGFLGPAGRIGQTATGMSLHFGGENIF